MRVFQLCAKHKSYKSSLWIFSNIFYLVRTSQDNYRDQGLASFHMDDPQLEYFTRDLGNFMEPFLLVKPCMLETHLSFCYFLDESSHLCKGTFLKYLSSYHFRRDVLFSCTKPKLIYPEETTMKETLNLQFQGFGYEEGFGPDEVPFSEAGKKQIDTYAIVSAVSWGERKYILVWTKSQCFLHVSLHFADKMRSCKFSMVLLKPKTSRLWFPL